MMFQPETASWNCPACNADMTLNDFRERQGYYCPACGVHLIPKLKGPWAYVLATLMIAFVIAYLQGTDSGTFVFRFFVYLGVITVAILYLSWPLKLPKKFVVDDPSVQTLGIKPPKGD